MIPVSRPYLPQREKLDAYLDGIYARNRLSNDGPLVQELTRRLSSFLGVEHLLLVANGTLALQVAYRALGVSTEAGKSEPNAITTPLTFVATASSLKWEGVDPVFGDVDAETWCLDPDSIAPRVTQDTRAVVPVHLFGNACDVEAIDTVARDYGLRVIYDGAHAFGVRYRGESLLSRGDASAVSFHATKAFHTVEGGAIVFRHKADLEQARSLINFGQTAPDRIEAVGLNAKMSEFHAAMGLCVLDELEHCLAPRREAWHAYEAELGGWARMQRRSSSVENNSYVYFPVAFADEAQMHAVKNALERAEIQARRYFYPALDRIPDLNPVRPPSARAGDLASRMLCLPMGQDRSETEYVLEILRGMSRSMRMQATGDD
ncbi:DegT/DnrJ/EryC1/StrS aminotransferase family protein [Thioalkalivibrio sp. ALJ1]|uniref:DegT/DnrJ/EryC1/StrS family aminotransferase n=1 Tax=Thioalkalivibrio sp. ALJ1 TaxID=1158144 RepID=UPI0005702F3D|nr:DegT/DnrJ/EryC1/StrS family aminotransferase [Thioalkalivibrio sp. ALJ1]